MLSQQNCSKVLLISALFGPVEFDELVPFVAQGGHLRRMADKDHAFALIGQPAENGDEFPTSHPASATATRRSTGTSRIP